MSTGLTTDAPAVRSVRNRIGLGLAALLALGDVVGMFTISEDSVPGEEGPPAAVLIAGGVIGLVTLAAVAMAWRTGGRGIVRVVAATRILAAALSLPAFFVDGVPPALVLVAATGVVLTVACVWLMLSPPRR